MPDVHLIVEAEESISSVDVRNQIFLLKAGSNESRSSGPEPRIIILKIQISDSFTLI